MGITHTHIFIIYSLTIVYVVGLIRVSGDDVIFQKRLEKRHQLDLNQKLDTDRPRKRPFCNAFKGCGKKRSDESMATLVELNSEPAVEALSKQILSEAKLWEAIQEARAEMERQRQEAQNMVPQNIPIDFTEGNFRRKRSNMNEIKEFLENVCSKRVIYRQTRYILDKSIISVLISVFICSMSRAYCFHLTRYLSAPLFGYCLCSCCGIQNFLPFQCVSYSCPICTLCEVPIKVQILEK